MIIRSLNGQEIYTLEEWFNYSPPAQPKLHWRDGRSAKELAKSWLKKNGPTVPIEITELLKSHIDTIDVLPEWGVPEYETKLDDFKGNGRNHDLLILGTARDKRTLISVEAKVDESFGDIVNDYVSKSIRSNPRSKVPDRITQLSEAIFGKMDIGLLRYQLLHAVAGTLIEAKNHKANQAIFIVHTFLPFGKQSKKAKQNDSDFQTFMQCLTGASIQPNQLVGPVFVHGGGLVSGDIPLYIGKLETVLGMNQWQVSIAAESVTASLFARTGYDVSIQYGANQPEYDLMVSKGKKMLKISVKGSQDGGWGLTQSHIKDAKYHSAADEWFLKHKPGTIVSLVQFKGVLIDQMPRVYLATPLEIVNHLKRSANGRGETILYEYKEWTAKAFGAGTIDAIPESWKFSEDRIKELLELS